MEARKLSRSIHDSGNRVTTEVRFLGRALYDYQSLIDDCKKPPNSPDSLDEIVKELGLRVLQPGDFYQI